jgi:DUF1365 family protein
MHSCLYQGYVQHRRLSPAKHVFRYGLYLTYLDLDELPSLLDGRHGLGRSAFAAASFRQSDHLGDPSRPLADAVADLVEERTGWRPVGPIRLLTLLRNWGYYFCPLCLYYCFDHAGQTVDAVVAEVSNTPWHDRHWYVLHGGNRIGEPAQLRFRHWKSFHVSPFLDLDMQYEWNLTEPDEQLKVGIINSRADERLFDVSMVLQRHELSRRSMRRTLIRFPWMTGRVIQAIYWQAIRLWWKKCPFYAHPKQREKSEPQEP